ncbi:MAG: hypothetical protein IPG96_14635 [Proteobacteria bacterium]|nr:hypothetical protein [Pseudomonadota bacterium]
MRSTLLVLGLLAACSGPATLVLQLAPAGSDPTVVGGRLTLSVIEVATGRTVAATELTSKDPAGQRRIFSALELVEGQTYRVRLTARFDEPVCVNDQPALDRRAVGLSAPFVYQGSLESVELYVGCADGTRAMGNPELRVFHTATWVPQDARHGRVWLTGGAAPSTVAFDLEDATETRLLRSIEAFDPFSGQFTPVAAELSRPRFLHRAALRGNGDLVLTGGLEKTSEDDAAEFVAVRTVERLRAGRIERLPELREGRGAHGQASAGPTGVAVFGGIGSELEPLASVELIDVSGETPAAISTLAGPAIVPAVLPFGDDRHVLVVGEIAPAGSDSPVEVFCLKAPCDCGVPPCARSIKGFGAGRSGFGAAGTLVPCTGGGGAIYLAGGGTEDPQTKADVMYNDIYCLDTRVAERLERVGELQRARSSHTITLVDGPRGPRLFVAGGGGPLPDTPSTAELVDVDCACGAIAAEAIQLVKLRGARAGHTATLLPDGTVLLVGSLVGAAAERFSPDR